jgi:ankyrin repeat protein
VKKIGLLVLIMFGFAQVSSRAEDYSKMSANELNEALIKAVKKGSSEEVQKLVQAGANVNQEIHYILTQGDCDWDATCTILEYAARNGYVAIVKELRKKAKNDDIDKALILAASEGHTEVVKELVQAKVTVDTLNRALLAAAGECHVNIIKELIKAGAQVNHPDERGDTALIKVIQYPFYTETYYKHRYKKHRAEAIQALLKAKANVNHANKIGNTALILAIGNHDIDAVQIFLQTPGIKINHANSDGNTALIRAIQCIQYSYIDGNKEEYNACVDSQSILEILLQTPGINLHHVNKNGDTAITLCQKKEEEMKYRTR